MTGVSLALLSREGGMHASERAPAAVSRPSAEPSRAIAGSGGAVHRGGSPSVGHPVAESACAQRGKVRAAGSEGPRGDAASSSSGAGAGGGAGTGAGDGTGVMRHEVLRQWGVSATLLLVPERWAGGGGYPYLQAAAGARDNIQSPDREPQAHGEPVSARPCAHAAHSTANGAAIRGVAGAGPARSSPARATSHANLAEGTPAGGVPPRKGLPRAAGRAKAGAAAMRGAPSAVEVRVEVALRALAPVLSAGAAAVALRMAARAGRYAAFWRHWRSRPGVPVAAAPIAW